jgi:thiamine biosynthesis protein ThiS
MTIKLNGDPHEVQGPLSISALLDQLAIDGRRVAVELNLAVVKKPRTTRRSSRKATS